MFVQRKENGIFFDISKAFDKIWHAGLIYKLYYLKSYFYLIEFIINFWPYIQGKSRCRVTNVLQPKIIKNYLKL